MEQRMEDEMEAGIQTKLAGLTLTLNPVTSGQQEMEGMVKKMQTKTQCHIGMKRELL